MKTKLIISILFFGLSVNFNGYGDRISSKIQVGGETVCRGLGASEKGKFQLEGIDISKYSYLEIHQYVFSDSNTLFILGRTEFDAIKLSTIDLRSGKSNSVVEYPLEGIYPIKNVRFAVFFMEKLNPKEIFVIVTFDENYSGMRAQLESVIIEIFRSMPGNRFTKMKRAEVEQMNIAYQKEDRKSKYLYMAVDESSSGDGDVEPAMKCLSRVILSDANADGFTDILVWKELHSSRFLEDEEKDDFIFDREGIYVMYFDRGKMKFSNLEVLN